jgi:molecular chaperone DnaJ
MSKRCFYEVLGVAREASTEEIRKSYKREALKHHPDRNQGDSAAEAKFKEANEAYQVLSDDQKRQIYDQFGHEGLQGGGGGGQDMGDMFSHMQDLFSEMFSGGFGFGGGGKRQQRGRGADLRVQQRLTLQEAAFGTKREVTVRAPSPCTDCEGSGAKAGTKPETCAQCRGSGQVSSARGFVMFTSPCGKCGGQGAVIKHPCKTCEGRGAVEKTRKVMVQFPAGLDAGQRLRVSGQGMAGVRGAPAGDLYVEIDVEEDGRFERDGADLVTRVKVSFTEAALGAEIPVPALVPVGHEGETTVNVSVPPGTQPGTPIALKNQGVPRLDGRGRGTLVAVIEVDVPITLTENARKLLAQLDDELKSHVADRSKKAASS